MTLYVGECRRCGAQRMSFEVYGVSTVVEAQRAADALRNYTYMRAIELACRCPECRQTTVFTLAATATEPHRLPSTKFDENQNPIALGYTELAVMPKRAISPTPDSTPEPAASFYRQGSAAIADALYDAAGAMFRKCLESVTRSDVLLKRFVPDDQRDNFRKAWLKTRIDKLKELHAIPPALGDLADVIKDEGDQAVHEDELYDKQSAEALQRFTETFLEQTFTIPAQIARVRGKKK